MTDHSGIYLLKNLVNNKIYVGSSRKVYNRMRVHRDQLSKQKHGNKYLQNAWNKYGSDSFVSEVIEACCLDDLEVREQWWINSLRSNESMFGYNLANPKRGVIPNYHMSAITKQRWSDPKYRSATIDGLDRGRAKTNSRRDEVFLAKRAAIFNQARAKAIAYNKTPEARSKQAQNSLDQWLDPKIQAIRLEALAKGRKKTNDLWYNPDSKVRKVREANLAKGDAVLQRCLKDPEWLKRRRTGIRTKDLWQDPEYRAHQLESMAPGRAKGQAKFAEIIKTPEFKAKQSERMRAQWADPEYRAKRLEGLERGQRTLEKKRKLLRAQSRDSLNNSENEAVEVADKEPSR